MAVKTLKVKSETRKYNKQNRLQISPDLICKTVDDQELKIKIENQLFPLFKRSMSAKHEKSTTYVVKAINGELPTMRIANRIRNDYSKYQASIYNLVTLFSNT